MASVTSRSVGVLSALFALPVRGLSFEKVRDILSFRPPIAPSLRGECVDGPLVSPGAACEPASTVPVEPIPTDS